MQYGGLGVTPLPLHGQVRPIKVEQGGEGGWSSSSLDTSHEAILSSTTPPILRRQPRKREADDNEFLSQHHDLSFDMTGSLTSTPTHTHHHGHHQQLANTGGLISNSGGGGTAVPPNAQSTPVSVSSSSDLHHLHHHQHHHSSLLTTPTLSSSNSTAVTTADMSAHSTPKLAKFSPERQHHARNSEAPRTPTPFKRALAEVYRGREPLSNTPQTPTKRVEDITEIIKKDLEDLTDLSFNRSMEHQVRIVHRINCKEKIQGFCRISLGCTITNRYRYRASFQTMSKHQC